MKIDKCISVNKNVSIPNKLINDVDINSKSKYLYILMCKLSVEYKLRVKYYKLMEIVKWKDRRTFKKCLNYLRDGGYIEYKHSTDRIYQVTDIIVNINKITPVTKLNTTLINKVLDSEDGTHNKEKGLLYLYYLESVYEEKYRYSSPNRKQLDAILGIRNNELKKIINYYHDNNICRFKRGWLNPENGKRIRSRYTVNQDNRLKLTKRVIDNKKDLIPFTNEFKILKDILRTSGLYFIYNEKKELIYIGKSGNVGNRIITSVRSENLQGEAYYINVKMLENKSDVNLYELYYISKFKPIYNKESKEEDEMTVELDDLDFTCGYVKIFDI